MRSRNSLQSGRRLYALREQLGLTQIEVVRAAGLSQPEVSRWESGQRAVSRTDRVQKGLSRALGLTPSQLFGYLLGQLEISDILPKHSALEEALTRMTARWSQTAIALAKELEPEALAFTTDMWVRRLDELESQVSEMRSEIRSKWQVSV